MVSSASHMQRPVRDYATSDFVQLPETMRVEAAVEFVRDYRAPGQSLIYFYVVDATGRLVGVLQTRSLLTAQADETVADVMIRRVIAIPETSTVLAISNSRILFSFRLRLA